MSKGFCDNCNREPKMLRSDLCKDCQHEINLITGFYECGRDEILEDK